MKLYKKKDTGEIVGTQKECGNKSNIVEYEVPTDKKGLIGFINDNLNTSPDSLEGSGGCSLEDFSSWLHIQPDKSEMVKGLCEVVSQFKYDREQTDKMIAELD